MADTPAAPLPADDEPTDAHSTDAQPTDAQPTDAQPTDAVPTEADDRRRIAEAEGRLDAVDDAIEHARAVDADARAHYQSGQLPQQRGDEGEGNAEALPTS